MQSIRTINHQHTCIDCNAFDTLLIGLDCNHSFCLVCMSYLYLKCRARGEKDDQVACSACNNPTKLDFELVQTINATIRGSLVPNLNMMSDTLQGSLSNIGSNPQRPFVRKQTPSQHGQHKRNIHQKLLKKLSDGTTRGDQQEQQPDKQHIISNKNFFIDSPKSIIDKNLSNNTQEFCKVHSFEEISYVCLTCEEYSLCTKCVNNKHRNHNVQSFGQAVQQITEWMSIKRHRNQQKIQVCEMRQRKLGERKLMVKSKWERVKEQIVDSFEQLRMKAKKRESELLEQCDQHYKMLQQSIEKELDKLSRNLDSLKSYKNDFRRLSSHDIFITDKKMKVVRAIEYFRLYNSLKDKLGDNTIKINLDDSLKDNSDLISYLSLNERELMPVHQTINLICLSEMNSPSMLTQPETSRMMVPDKYTSLNSSRERTKRTLKTEEDSTGLMSKRRTQQILETYDRLSHKKGIDNKVMNYPSHISKFFDKQTVYGQKIKFNDTESMYSIAAKSKAASTKLLSKTNGPEGFTQPKTKKQLNLTKQHIEFRTINEDLGSPQCLFNYKGNNIFESKRKKVSN